MKSILYGSRYSLGKHFNHFVLAVRIRGLSRGFTVFQCFGIFFNYTNDGFRVTRAKKGHIKHPMCSEIFFGKMLYVFCRRRCVHVYMPMYSCTDIVPKAHTSTKSVETGRARMRNDLPFVKNLQLCKKICTRFSLRGRKCRACIWEKKSNKIRCTIFFSLFRRYIPFL